MANVQDNDNVFVIDLHDGEWINPKFLNARDIF